MKPNIRLWFVLLTVGFCQVSMDTWFGTDLLLAAELKRDFQSRLPVDLALSRNEDWLVTVNQASDSLTLVDCESGKLLDELRVGDKPADVALCLGGNHVLVSCRYEGNVHLVEVQAGQLKSASIRVGYEPTGLAVAPDGETAYVGLYATGEVAELDLIDRKIVRRISVGDWPNTLAVSPDGTRVAVGCSGEGKLAVIETATGEVAYKEGLIGGINIGDLQCSADSQHVYFPWMVYRSNPITPDNIRRGWVLASRIGRVRLDGPEYREAISLDVPGKAVADPHGLVMNHDETRLVVSAGGTHELLVYRLPDLPFVGIGGPGDLIDRRLLRDDDLFYRIDVGGRPLGMKMSSDGRTVYVANAFRESVQVVDIESREILKEISLVEVKEKSLARQGMEIFYDGQRSLDQWYSCHSCHQQGGINAKAMDTTNDGSDLTMKTVLPLEQLQQTGPWTWHGWQTDLQHAMRKSFTETMQGEEPSQQETEAILAYLNQLEPGPNPFRDQDGSLSASAQRGRTVFESDAAGCANCHSGPHFTDGKVHNVGLGSDDDVYKGFNTPVLRGLYRKVHYLHDGRHESLEGVLREEHSPEKVGGLRPLSEKELHDLIAYLKSL